MTVTAIKEEPKTATAGQPQAEALATVNVTETVLAELEEKYTGLKIKGLDDKSGFQLVRNGRIYCKSLRVAAQKICKQGREEAILEQKRWLDAEKKVTARIKKVEDELQAEERRITEEKERIKREKQEAEARRVAGIIEQFAQYGRALSFNEASAMTEEGMTIRLNEAKAEHEAKLAAEEAARKEREEIERRQREEAERLRAEREKLEQERKEIEERERIAKEMNEAAEREVELLKAKEEAAAAAAEKAREEERSRIEHERAAEAQREAERTRREEEAKEQRPDKEKLLALATALLNYDLPAMRSAAGVKILQDAEGMLKRMSEYIINKANTL